MSVSVECIDVSHCTNSSSIHPQIQPRSGSFHIREWLYTVWLNDALHSNRCIYIENIIAYVDVIPVLELIFGELKFGQSTKFVPI